MKVNSIELRVCETRFGTRGGRKDGANLASSTAKASHVFDVARKVAAEGKDKAESASANRAASRTFVRTPSSNEEAVSLLEKFERQLPSYLENFNQYKHAYTDTKKTLFSLYEINKNTYAGMPTSIQNTILNKLSAYSFKYYKVQMVLVGEDGTRVYSKVQPRMEWSDPSKPWERKITKSKEKSSVETDASSAVEPKTE
jgi:hypothetical protein